MESHCQPLPRTVEIAFNGGDPSTVGNGRDHQLPEEDSQDLIQTNVSQISVALLICVFEDGWENLRAGLWSLEVSFNLCRGDALRIFEYSFLVG